MPDPLDLDLLAARNLERRRLKAGATEGPWECEQYVVFAPDGETIVGGDAPRTDYDPACADAVFIANARNDDVEADVDALLAEVRRLREELDARPVASRSVVRRLSVQLEHDPERLAEVLLKLKPLPRPTDTGFEGLSDDAMRGAEAVFRQAEDMRRDKDRP